LYLSLAKTPSESELRLLLVVKVRTCEALENSFGTV
jgi:hypothetical protein